MKDFINNLSIDELILYANSVLKRTKDVKKKSKMWESQLQIIRKKNQQLKLELEQLYDYKKF